MIQFLASDRSHRRRGTGNFGSGAFMCAVASVPSEPRFAADGLHYPQIYYAMPA